MPSPLGNPWPPLWQAVLPRLSTQPHVAIGCAPCSGSSESMRTASEPAGPRERPHTRSQAHTQPSLGQSLRLESSGQIDYEIWYITNLESLCLSLPGNQLKRKGRFFMHVGVDYPSYMMRLHAHPSESPQSLGSLLGGSNRSDSSAIYVSNGNLSCDSSISTCASVFPRVPYSALPPGKRGCTWCAESELLACTLLKKKRKNILWHIPCHNKIYNSLF